MVEERASRSSAATMSVDEGGEDGGEEEASVPSSFSSVFSFFSRSPLLKTPEATEARAVPKKSCEREGRGEEKASDEMNESIDRLFQLRDARTVLFSYRRTRFERLSDLQAARKGGNSQRPNIFT